MQNYTDTSLPENDHQTYRGKVTLFLKRLISERPFLGTLLLFFYWLLLFIAISRIIAFPLQAAHIHLSPLQRSFFGEPIPLLIIIPPISLLGWWSTIGFLRGINGRGIVLCIAPFILVAVISLLVLIPDINRAPQSVWIMAILAALMIGIAEEGMFRGLILQSLLPKGIWPAVLISSLLFACIHLINLISGFSFSYIIGQMIGALGLGILFAAIRLRTRSIWPVVLLHAARDLPGLVSGGINPSIYTVSSVSTIVIIIAAIYSLILIFNAYLLLLPDQLPKIKIAYGLSPVPTPPHSNQFTPYPNIQNDPIHSPHEFRDPPMFSPTNE